MCFENCRPLGFLIGLPFALVSFILSAIGVLLWVITFTYELAAMVKVEASLIHANPGVPLMFCCPCIICFTLLAELAISLIKAPFRVMTWFTDQIPC